MKSKESEVINIYTTNFNPYTPLFKISACLSISIFTISIILMFFFLLIFSTNYFWGDFIIIFPFIIIPWLFAYLIPLPFIQTQLVITRKNIIIIPPYSKVYWWNTTKRYYRGPNNQFMVFDGGIQFFSMGFPICYYPVIGNRKTRMRKIKKLSLSLHNIGFTQIDN